MREKWGCLEINWNTGTTGTLFFSPRLLKCCDASFLQGPSLPRMSSSLRPFLWWPFPSLAPAICSKLRQKGISVSLRLLASPCVSFHPHHPLSHVISPNRIQSHRIALLGWQKDLTLQHEHDSWVGPPPDWPRQTPASPAESMSPRSLTYWHTKGGPNLWQARRPPLSPKERREIPYVSSRRKSSAWRVSSSPTVCCILAW